MIVFLFLWGAVFPLCSALMAYKRNRNVALWLLLGILGGFFTYLMIAFLPKVCPYCKASFNKSPDYLHCGVCKKADELNNEEKQLFVDYQSMLTKEKMSLKRNGVKFKLIEKSGAVVKLIGLDALNDYLQNAGLTVKQN